MGCGIELEMFNLFYTIHLYLIYRNRNMSSLIATDTHPLQLPTRNQTLLNHLD